MAKRNKHDYLNELKQNSQILSEFVAQVESGKTLYIRELAGKLRVIYCNKSGTKSLLESVLSRFEIEFFVRVNTKLLEHIVRSKSIFIYNNSSLSWLSGKGEMIPLLEAIEIPDFKYNGRIFSYKDFFEELADKTVIHVDEEIDDDLAFLRKGSIRVLGLSMTDSNILDVSKVTSKILDIIFKHIEESIPSPFVKDRKEAAKIAKRNFSNILDHAVPFHLIRHGKNQEAIKWFEEVKARNNAIGADHILLASWAHIQIGNLELDRATATQFKDIDKINASWKAIKDSYTKAIDINPKMWEAHYSLSNALVCEANALSRFDLQLANIKWEEANSTLKILSKENQDNPSICILLATSLSTQANKNADISLDFSRELWRASREKYQHANSLIKLPSERLVALALTYRDEAKHVSASNYPQATTTWNESRAICNQLLEDVTYKEKALDLISNLFCDEAKAASILGPTHCLPLWEKATDANRKLLTQPTTWQQQNNLGWTLMNEADCYFSVGSIYPEAVDCIDNSIKSLGDALSINPSSILVKRNLGRAFLCKAKIHEEKSPIDAHQHWTEAENYLRMVIKSKPNDSEAHCFLAEAIDGRANRSIGSDLKTSTDLWRKSDGHYSAALKIKKNQSFVLNEWGRSLKSRSEKLMEANEDLSFHYIEQSTDKFRSSLLAKPSNLNGLHGLTFSLYSQAKMLSLKDRIEEATDLWEESVEKADLLVKTHPTNFNFLSLKGLVLLERHSYLKVEQQNPSLLEAKELFLMTEKSAPGHSSYNLACFFSIQSNIEESIFWLRNSEAHKMLPSVQHMESDRDLHNIRSDARFREWLSNYKKKTVENGV